MTPDEMREVLSHVSVPDFRYEVFNNAATKQQDMESRPEVVRDFYLQGRYMEADIVTGDETDQHTRKWRLSEHMTPSELVQTAFKCYLTSMEHRAREHFKYRGKRIFGPHFDVDALHEICRDENLDYRREWNEQDRM
jgi:hypothetical protein